MLRLIKATERLDTELTEEDARTQRILVFFLSALRALCVVERLALRGGGGSLTPARLAFGRPIAIA